MSVLSFSGLPSPLSVAAYRTGVEFFLKQAEVSAPEISYSLFGTLHLSSSGWLLLSVPNALVNGVFAAMKAPGVELPPSGPDGNLNAHISVASKAEVAQIGADKITERGKQFAYTLDKFVTVEPAGWPEMAAVYFIKIKSPELQRLRLSYGLSALPGGGEKPFHITCAVRRRGVLGHNDKAKN